MCAYIVFLARICVGQEALLSKPLASGLKIEKQSCLMRVGQD